MTGPAVRDPVPGERQPAARMAGFVTIGHSNRTSQTVIEMLRAADVELVADVRAFPRSRSNPAYNIESFPAELSKHGIRYRHLPALGGRRSRQPEVDDTVNAFWRIQSFHNYADYALGAEFQAALSHLEQLGREHRLALLCAEALWWRCHRRIITDYLLAAGHDVLHLLAPGKSAQAELTGTAKVRADTRIVYPAAADPPDATPGAAGNMPLCHYEELARRENEAREKSRRKRS